MKHRRTACTVGSETPGGWVKQGASGAHPQGAAPHVTANVENDQPAVGFLRVLAHQAWRG